jgi:hypothetical protein
MMRLGWGGARLVGLGSDVTSAASHVGEGLENTAQAAFDKALADERATQHRVLWAIGLGALVVVGVGVAFSMRGRR